MNGLRWAVFASLAGLLLVLGGCGGGSSLSATNATPVPQSMIPSNITAGSDTFTVFITGSGFGSSQGRYVRLLEWRAALNDLQSNHQPADRSDSGFGRCRDGVGNVTLVNPPPGGGPSQNGLDFTIVAPTRGADDYFVFSRERECRDKAFALTVNGDNFTVNDVVTWNGSVRRDNVHEFHAG